MKKLASVAVVALSAMVSQNSFASVAEEDFRLDTFKDLVTLCGVAASDPNASAAIHMCHGYVTGLVHFHELVGRALEGTVYCLAEDKRPARDDAIGMLVNWSRDHPEYNSEEAIDGVLRWLAAKYPCN
jgi:hypothetical protein